MQTMGAADYRQRERTRPRRRPGKGQELGSAATSSPDPPLPKPAPVRLPPPKPEEEWTWHEIAHFYATERSLFAQWLMSYRPQEIGEELWERVASDFRAIIAEQRAHERGPLNFLSEPLDTAVGPPIEFPPGYKGPIVGGKWKQLPDGRIVASGLTLFDLRAMIYFRNLAEEGRELVEQETQTEREHGD